MSETVQITLIVCITIIICYVIDCLKSIFKKDIRKIDNFTHSTADAIRNIKSPSTGSGTKDTSRLDEIFKRE